MNEAYVWQGDAMWCHRVRELKAGLLTRRSGAVFSVGEEELLLVQTSKLPTCFWNVAEYKVYISIKDLKMETLKYSTWVNVLSYIPSLQSVHTASRLHQRWHTSVTSLHSSLPEALLDGVSLTMADRWNSIKQGPLWLAGWRHMTPPLCVCVCVSWLCCDTNSSSALITTNTHSHIVYLYPGLDVVNIITEQSNLCVHARLMWHMEPNVPVSRKKLK